MQLHRRLLTRFSAVSLPACGQPQSRAATYSACKRGRDNPPRWRARNRRGYKIIRIRVTRADEIKLTALGYCQGATLAEATEAWVCDSLAAAEIPATRDGTV